MNALLVKSSTAVKPGPLRCHLPGPNGRTLCGALPLGITEYQTDAFGPCNCARCLTASAKARARAAATTTPTPTP